MKIKKYLNQENEELYILHFPGNGMDGHEYIVRDNLDRPIKIINNLSIICVMNKAFAKTSPLQYQCDKNGIKIYNSALNERAWNNTLKIGYILECLNEINTDYALILDGRDVVICNDLDDSFIEKFKSFNKPIVYNGTPMAFPPVYVESLNDIMHVRGKQRYLNAGVCIGEKNSLIDFYTKSAEINKQHPDNISEQFIIRCARKKYPELVTHDSENKIFRIIHANDTLIDEVDEYTIRLI